MSKAITLHVFEEGPIFRAQCDYPVVHAIGESEQEAIAKATAFIQEMLAEADQQILRDQPNTLIVRILRDGVSSVTMQPLHAATPPENFA